MKHYVMSAIAVLLLSAASVPAMAQDTPSPKGPPKTMGNEGKLPATGTMNKAVPEMGATGSSSGETGTSTSPKGPPQTMGNEGKLPSTGTMSGAVPKMRAPEGTEK